MFGNPTLITPFDNFIDSVGVDYNDPTLCQLYYTILPAADCTTYGINLGTNQIEFWTADSTLINTQVPLTLQADAVPQQDLPSTLLKFNATVADPCPSTTIALPTLLKNLEIISTNDTTVTS